ncbi:MAG: glycoside hydrolase family 13 protein [Bacilli bacterium]|nr:glycoside hydrolase family 13 protein [Bacilli bacterium]MBN2876183.1 glycoside hydrolase family 13 protein [Bacilli bacterium]
MKQTYKERQFQIQSIFEERERDWRNGAVVYQVLVDRFAPAHNLEQKKHLYQSPKVLKSWNETPKPGPFLKEIRYTAHEMEYWGGDLQSLQEKVDYIKSLGVDVLYLNPIHLSLSNHKYDASDYLQISPEYGTMAELKRLANVLHDKQMKLMLDGVFNHVGVTSELFQNAKDPSSPKHGWFDFDKKYEDGVRLWADARSLPELNLENQAVKDYIYQDKDSVIRTYLRQGIDGWRLDVAFDLGFEVLSELTKAAHEEKPGSMVVGEIWNYPETWLENIDGLMNFTFREIINRSLKGDIPASKANRMFAKIIEDAGIEGILKSWNVLDNHDVPRLRDQLPNQEDQMLAQVLQFTLPGSPNLYYGTELGMTGGDDPRNRAPMRWDLVSDDNKYLSWTKSLIEMHQERALRIGDFVPILSDSLIAFLRRTDKVEDTVIVLINISDHTVKEDILIPDSKLMNYTKFDTLLGHSQPMTYMAGVTHVELDAKSYLILKPHTKPIKSYTPYKRV